mmetsp:Transcript_23497/g.42775  ORF Transcript_23497/g.42775 Transcript_23497/m.42775 type:complete len:83 (+) Transcript_23497:135-383(+)
MQRTVTMSGPKATWQQLATLSKFGQVQLVVQSEHLLCGAISEKHAKAYNLDSRNVLRSECGPMSLNRGGRPSTLFMSKLNQG